MPPPRSALALTGVCLVCLLEPRRRGDLKTGWRPGATQCLRCRSNSMGGSCSGCRRGKSSAVPADSGDLGRAALGFSESGDRVAAAEVAAAMLMPWQPRRLHLYLRCPFSGRLRRATADPAGCCRSLCLWGAAPRQLCHAVPPLPQHRFGQLYLAGPAQCTPRKRPSAASITPWTGLQL